MQPKTDLKGLQQLGLTDRESRVYYTLVTHGPIPIRLITARTEIPRSKIYETFRKLLQLGLIIERHLDGKKLYEAVRPDDAIQRLLTYREEEMEQYRQTGTQMVQELMGVLNINRYTNNAQDYFTFLQDPKQIKRHIEELLRMSKTEILWFNKAPDFVIHYPHEWTLDVLRRGVRFREIVEEVRAMDDEFLKEQVFPYMIPGYEPRVHSNVAIKLVVFDGKISLFQFEDEATPAHRTTIVIENRGIAAAFTMCFEKYWQECMLLDDFLREHKA